MVVSFYKISLVVDLLTNPRMVSVEFEGDYIPLRHGTGSEQSKNSILGGIRAPIFQLGLSTSSYSDPYYAGEQQSLLDSLLLAQWEDHSLKGLLKYDVTSCETKIIGGEKKFVALLNENWTMNLFADYENKIPFLSSQKLDYVENDIHDLLFCVVIGNEEGPTLISSASVPKDGIFVVTNENPVEYGHVFMVPCDLYNASNVVGKRSLDLVTGISEEINNCFFHAFYDHIPSNPMKYFQACYFPNPFPVELMPVVTFFAGEEGICISELADYPIKTLVFSSNKPKSLVAIVSWICFHLEELSTPFSLVISDCGMKIFLFPQVQVPGDRNLSAWECAGHFIFNQLPDFNEAMEEEILKHLAAFSLGDEGFEELKKLCGDVATSKAGRPSKDEPPNSKF